MCSLSILSSICHLFLLKKPALPPKCPSLNLDVIIYFSVQESPTVCSRPTDAWDYFGLLSQIQFSFSDISKNFEFTQCCSARRQEFLCVSAVNAVPLRCGHAVMWFQAVSQSYSGIQAMVHKLMSLILLPCLGVCYQAYA